MVSLLLDFSGLKAGPGLDRKEIEEGSGSDRIPIDEMKKEKRKRSLLGNVTPWLQHILLSLFLVIFR